MTALCVFITLQALALPPSLRDKHSITPTVATAATTAILTLELHAGLPCAVAFGGGLFVSVPIIEPQSMDTDEAHAGQHDSGARRLGCNATHCVAGYEAIYADAPTEWLLSCRACPRGSYKHFADLSACLLCENNIAPVRLHYTHTAETHRFCHYECRKGRLGTSCTNPITVLVYALSAVTLAVIVTYNVCVISARAQMLKDR
jgi:hypothetical protein